jgi:glycosyltransferase involved in cell wall biosynthesis
VRSDDSMPAQRPDVAGPALVTIGIPCFGARDTVLRALKSALVQDWPAIEVVVVDDCSLDDSAERVARAIAREPRARLVRHDRNIGPAGARNTIIAEARGAFIAFFDDDDESRPNRVREQIRVMTAHENATGARLIACHAAGERRYSSGYTKPLPAIGSRGSEPPHGSALADYLLFYRRRPGWFYGSGTPSCSLLARRETFAAVGAFDARLRRVEDVDFAIRLAMMGGHFIGTAEPLFIQYATTAPDKSPEANRDAEIALAEKHRSYLRPLGRYDYARRWPELRYWHFKRRYDRFALEFLMLLLRNPVAATRHILATGPARLRHERRIRRGSAQ